LLSLLLHLFGFVSVPSYAVRIRTVEPKQLTIDLDRWYPIEKPDPYLPEPYEKPPSKGAPADTTALAPGQPVPELPEFGRFVAYDRKPEFIRCVAPDYPEMAIKAGLEGTVSAYLLVGIDGRVLDARIMSGPEAFHEAVRAAAMASLLSPAKRGDMPVAVWIAIPYRFSLGATR
jgi:protein TonB